MQITVGFGTVEFPNSTGEARRVLGMQNVSGFGTALQTCGKLWFTAIAGGDSTRLGPQKVDRFYKLA